MCRYRLYETALLRSSDSIVLVFLSLLTLMAKLLFSSTAVVILLSLFTCTISTAQAVSCTMCDSCDNPCLPPASPPPPSPPSSVACPPPPKSGPYYTPPFASGGSGGGNSYYYPPPATGGGSANSYGTPPPPNPILPYFPFYFYGPPPPGKAQTSGTYWIKALPSVYLLFGLWIFFWACDMLRISQILPLDASFSVNLWPSPSTFFFLILRLCYFLGYLDNKRLLIVGQIERRKFWNVVILIKCSLLLSIVFSCSRSMMTLFAQPSG